MVRRVSRKLLYVLVFVTPFIFGQTTNELFEFPKLYFVYGVGSLLIVSTVLGQLWARRPTRTYVFRAALPKLVGLFTLSFVVSTVWGSHLYTSVWGYFSRYNGGLVSVLVFFGIYWATRTVHPPLLTVLRSVALTLLPISVFGILQHFGLGGTWASDTTARAFATFGQPNWYAAYCATVLPILVYLGLCEDRQLAKIGWFALFVLGFGGFWYAYSVSGIVGLVVSVGLLLVVNTDLVKQNRLALGGTTLLCLGFAVLNPGIFSHKVTDAFSDVSDLIQSRTSSQQPATGQSTPVTLLEIPTHYAVTDSGFIRKELWRGTVQLAGMSAKTVLVGTGPETFPYTFQKYRPTSLNYSSEWNYILNKPHNYYLELLSQNGVIGLLIYLAIGLTVLVARHRVFTPALCGLFTTNIFGWPTVSTSLLFWVMLALLTTDKTTESTESRHSGLVKVAVSTVLLLAYVVVNVQFARHYLADTANKKSQDLFAKGNVQQALSYANTAVRANPYEPFYYRTRAKTYVLQTAGQDTDITQQLKLLALADMDYARKLNPNNLLTLRGLVPLYYFLALKDISATEETAKDPGYVELARERYTQLVTSYPTDVGVLVLVAKYQKLLGLTEDYTSTIDRVAALRPDLLEWYVH
jgi:tetratricopeptide (TPR) repeat protein